MIRDLGSEARLAPPYSALLYVKGCPREQAILYYTILETLAARTGGGVTVFVILIGALFFMKKCLKKGTRSQIRPTVLNVRE